jgi:MazG family protein
MPSTIKKTNSIQGVADFLETVQALRHPKTGCPWDLAQSHESLTKYLLEESHEFIQSLDSKGIKHPDTAEELSDVLLQIGLHSQMAAEKNIFNFDKIAQVAAQKIRDRHPHVFDPDFPKFKTPDQVNLAWESIKARIKAKKGIKTTETQKPPISKSLRSVPTSLPALQKSQRLGEKMASLGFDWPSPNACFDKIKEEIQELKQSKTAHSQQEEWGDLVFALCQWARLQKWDSEQLLQKANEKFIKRCETMEQLCLEQGVDFSKLPNVESQEKYWQKAKAKLKQRVDRKKSKR